MMINEDILAKFFVDETSKEEKEAIEKWLEIEENKAIYTQFEKIWNGIGIVKNEQKVNVDAAWNKVKLKTLEKGTPLQKTTTFQSQKSFSWRMAASIVGLIVAPFFIYWILFKNPSTQKDELISFSTQKEAKEFLLPDSSVVWLDKNSTIRFSKNFTTRNITLKGTALLKVRPNPSKPFTVQANDIKVEVLGTVFSVSTTENQVIVQEGKVSVEANTKKIILEKNDKAVLIGKNLEKQVNTDKNFASFSNKVFIFENEPLNRVLEKLNRVYDKKIVLTNPALANCRITVTFKEETIENISQTISETLKLGVQIKENEIFLDGTTCQ
ncbi:MAG: FecR family protein [Raineya sp.]|jgi:ferric-dicitrate binding protein FerR (iron transport regulator)|nr:FecR family protein [Raineya sp.]